MDTYEKSLHINIPGRIGRDFRRPDQPSVLQRHSAAKDDCLGCCDACFGLFI